MEDIYYVGLHKLQWLAAMHGSDSVVASRTNSTYAGTVSLTPSLVATSTHEQTATTPDLTTAAALPGQLSRARRLLAGQAVEAAAPVLVPGDWINFAGWSDFGVMGRDSWNGDRPWCAFWFSDATPLDGTFGRWLVLTGTAKGNWVQAWDGAAPGNRSGSQTESFFDLAHQYAAGAPAAEVGEARWAFEQASSIRGMGNLEHGPCYGLAQVLQVLHCASSGHVVHAGGRPVPVVELVLATPLFVARGRPDAQAATAAGPAAETSEPRRRWPWRRRQSEPRR